MSVRIEEFRFNQSPWRISWLGRIVYPSESETDAKICVHLSELRTSWGDALSNSALAELSSEEDRPANPGEAHRLTYVNVGLLPLLTIGSVWIDGVSQPLSTDRKLRSFEVHNAQFDLVSFDGCIAIDGQSFPVLAANRYRIGGAASRQCARSWIAVAYNPDPRTLFVGIPSTVLFQHCLATSPKAIRRLIFGQLDKIVGADHGFCEESPDTFYVNLFKDFRGD